MVCAMRKAGVLSILFVVTLLAVAVIAEAQQSKKVSRVGLVTQGPDTGVQSMRLQALREGLRELGWVEERNIAIERRSAKGSPERAEAIADEIVRLKVDVVVWSGGVEAVKKIKTVPVVFVGTSDPVLTGLVESLARPGGNVTGLTSLAPELGGKRLELLKESIPKISRVAFVFDPASASNAVELEQLRGPAAGLGLALRPVEARGPDEIAPAFSMMVREGAEGLSTASGTVNNTNRARIIEMALKNRLPGVYHESQFADAGGLMSYGPNLPATFRRAAYFVDRILKGAKPADLPVEQPTKFELVINLRTAKQIGVTIPNSVLAKTDRVIK
jgi:putative tryptophan/tyrosine transport system substrate-binding protein